MAERRLTTLTIVLCTTLALVLCSGGVFAQAPDADGEAVWETGAVRDAGAAQAAEKVQAPDAGRGNDLDAAGVEDAAQSVQAGVGGGRWWPSMRRLSDPLVSPVPPGLPLRPYASLAVRPALSLKSVELSVDFGADSIRRTASVMGVDVEYPISCSVSQYSTFVSRGKLGLLWRREARRGIRDVTEVDRRGGLFSIDLPVQFPRAVQAIVGKGKPNLRVTGSETISFSGQSNWTVGQKYSEYGRQSKFPRLDMRQDLVVKLDGTIGDKIDVDWDQSSVSQTELQNRIRIRYHGYDDEIIQSVDLGNTNLSIPNTQYVSYSGMHEGLFGVKTVAKLGSVDLTMIASKQEAKSDKQRIVGGAKTVQKQISDLDYRKRTYFFLDPPDFGRPFSRFDFNSLEIYVDDRNGYNDTAAVRCKAYLYLPDGSRDTTYLDGNFVRLSRDSRSYDIIFDFFTTSYPILVMNGGLPTNHILAIAYRDTVFTETGSYVRTFGNTQGSVPWELKLVAPPVDELELDLTKGRWASLRRYELKNVYYLGSESIIKDSFTLTVKKRSGGTGIDEEALNGVPYLKILGLDQRGIIGAAPDGIVDGEVLKLDDGVMVFRDLQPFAPDSFDIYGNWLANSWPRPDTLTGTDANPNVYNKRSPNYYLDTRYYLDVSYRSPQTTFFLGWNVLENSEVVTLNGVRLVRGVGYVINYDTGELTLLAPEALEPTSEVSVDFSRSSLFGLSKSLLGISSQFKPSDDISFSTTWLYESKGTVEERPRLEQEPSRTIVGGVSGVMRFSPGFMTSLVDALPLVETREKSSLSIAGEFGISVPNPNTRNEVYLDDMEGARETRPLGLLRTQWHFSGIPESKKPFVQLSTKRPLWWYNLHPEFNANVVRARDLYPELTTSEERDRIVT
ncbi:MAG: hypothetical protein V2A71_07170, partial [Candidatus Eisenbacteria bacterium]